jgi:hypothetical protein
MKNQQLNSCAHAGTLEGWNWRIMNFEERLLMARRRVDINDVVETRLLTRPSLDRQRDAKDDGFR